MNLSDFNYYNNLKNRLAGITSEMETAKKRYIVKMTDLEQLKNDYDVDTVDQLAIVLNDGDDDQKTVDIKNALMKPDKKYLFENAAKFDNTASNKFNDLNNEDQAVANNLKEVEDFYKDYVIPHINDIKANKVIDVLEVRPGNNSSDTSMRFNFLSTFDDFQEFFKDANYVDEIVQDHLKNKTPISLMITKDNYPNALDVTYVKEGE